MPSRGTGKSTRTVTRTKGEVTKSQASKYMSEVPEGNVFWCSDGKVVKDMTGLRDALAMMSDQTFRFHSNEIKKDFSNWIQNVVGDEELAREMRRTRSRDKALKIVESRCNLLHQKIEGT
ncbi:MAG: hypothetical protein PHU23_05000 [Dehalococcoidales bacterium]|nr:hypothetical protein [Dehalococcoidales bacterium]